MSIDVKDTTEAYRLVHDGILDLHELFFLDKQRSEEADAIRDEMDEPWLEISDQQQRLLSGLSMDLNDIKQVAEPEKAVGPMAGPKIMKALEHQHDGRFAEALELLRDSKDSKPFSRISYYRGRNWEGLNEPRTALLFFKHACQLAPFNDLYQASALGALCAAFPKKGTAEVERVLANFGPFMTLPLDNFPGPMLAIRASEIKFDEIHQTASEDEKLNEEYSKIARALHITLHHMYAAGQRAAHAQPVYSVLYSLLATCYEHLEKYDDAYDFYTSAIGLDPSNAPLLIARGKLMYGKSETALQDFDRAIEMGTDLAIPYYFFAHHFLNSNQLTPAVSSVEEGLKRNSSKRLRSELFEFKAMA